MLMIVDDHARFRSAIRHWIERLKAGFELIDAASGEEAVALAATREVDIVLMDIALPGMNGMEATRRIKSASPHTRVIMLTAYDESPFRDAAQAAGASAYVLKSRVPDDLESLLAALPGERGRGPSHGTPDDRGSSP